MFFGGVARRGGFGGWVGGGRSGWGRGSVWEGGVASRLGGRLGRTGCGGEGGAQGRPAREQNEKPVQEKFDDRDCLVEGGGWCGWHARDQGLWLGVAAGDVIAGWGGCVCDGGSSSNTPTNSSPTSSRWRWQFGWGGRGAQQRTMGLGRVRAGLGGEAGRRGLGRQAGRDRTGGQCSAAPSSCCCWGAGRGCRKNGLGFQTPRATACDDVSVWRSGCPS